MAAKVVPTEGSVMNADIAALTLTEPHQSDSDGNDLASEAGDETTAVTAGGAPPVGEKKKKKKKKKPKRKTKIIPQLGAIPSETPTPPLETAEAKAKWETRFSGNTPKSRLVEWGLLEDRLDTFFTPSCRNLELLTPRLKLRPVLPGDTTGIRRIKMEPIVQKTQLYGSPEISHIKDIYQTRYVRSAMPRLDRANEGVCRSEYIFAITAKDPAVIKVAPPGQIKLRNRIENAEGYLGNIALILQPLKTTPCILPKPNIVYTHPTFKQCDELQLTGRLFYEIHPQLWGQGIMSEAFREVMRFAFEEVGITIMIANTASIKLCTSNGLRYKNTSVDNAFGKPQLFHEITRSEWFARNRPEAGVKDHWGGKEVCRWCLNFRLAKPTFNCTNCDWAKYCSRECQWADWVRMGGHEAECRG